jgi:hypothetical protein
MRQPLGYVDRNGISKRGVSQAVDPLWIEMISRGKRPAFGKALDTLTLRRRQAPNATVGKSDVGAAPIRPGVPCRACIQAIRYSRDERPFDRISKDFLKGGKSGRPIWFALLSIPRAAFGLKKYACGTTWVSITSNNVDSSARLGDSEVFAVKHAPAHAIPEFGQCANDDSEVPSSVAREQTWNVLDDENSGTAVSK